MIVERLLKQQCFGKILITTVLWKDSYNNSDLARILFILITTLIYHSIQHRQQYVNRQDTVMGKNFLHFGTLCSLN